MKIFDRAGKINFVDENNVYLGYDMESQCCEDFGWFIADAQVSDVAGFEVGLIEDLGDWRFDVDFFRHVDLCPAEYDIHNAERTLVIFRIVCGDREKFIHLYNLQTGYYSHGFTMNVGGEVMRAYDL